MAEIVTTQFGRIEYDERAVIHFPCGLPGFENRTRFLLIERPTTRPLVFLQSIDSSNLCLVTAPVNAIDPQYHLAMTPEDQQTISQAQEPLCLFILSEGEKGWTANMLAPVVINKEAGIAVQAVRADSLYSHQHPLTEARPCS